MYKVLNSVSNNEILAWSQLIGFAGDLKLKITQFVEFFLDRLINIVGKGEYAGYQHFLLFP